MPPNFDSGFETYTVVSQIGSGGSGTVFEVKNSQGQRLALKSVDGWRGGKSGRGGGTLKSSLQQLLRRQHPLHCLIRRLPHRREVPHLSPLARLVFLIEMQTDSWNGQRPVEARLACL